MNETVMNAKGNIGTGVITETMIIREIMMKEMIEEQKRVMRTEKSQTEARIEA